jgi:hypothetical protein
MSLTTTADHIPYSPADPRYSALVLPTNVPVPSSAHTELSKQDRLVIALADYYDVYMKDEDETAGIQRIIKRLSV